MTSPTPAESPDGRTLVPYHELEELSLEGRTLPLGDAMDAHNQAAYDQFGDQARTISYADGVLLISESDQYRIKYGISAAKFILNTESQHPDEWVLISHLAVLFAGTSFQHKALEKRLGRLFEHEKIGTRGIISLAKDLMWTEARTGLYVPRSMDTRSPTETTPEPASPKPAAARKPEVVIPKTVTPRFAAADIGLLKMGRPKRIARITNLPLMNHQTRAIIADRARQNPSRPALEPNKLVILNNNQAEFNGEPYESGPYNFNILHVLLKNYFKGFVAVKELDTHDTRHDSFESTEAFLQKLAFRKIVFYKSDEYGDYVLLRPVLIEDRRQ